MRGLSASFHHRPNNPASPGQAVRWLGLALLLAGPLASWAQSPASGSGASASTRIGTVKDIKGDVWLGPEGTRRPMASGGGVQEADRLSTGPQGAASLTLKDGTVVTLGPNSTVDLSKFQYNSTTQEGSFTMKLLQGSVRVVTGLLAKINPSLFNIVTPTSVVGVRGTDFIVEANAAQ